MRARTHTHSAGSTRGRGRRRKGRRRTHRQITEDQPTSFSLPRRICQIRAAACPTNGIAARHPRDPSKYRRARRAESPIAPVSLLLYRLLFIFTSWRRRLILLVRLATLPWQQTCHRRRACPKLAVRGRTKRRQTVCLFGERSFFFLLFLSLSSPFGQLPTARRTDDFQRVRERVDEVRDRGRVYAVAVLAVRCTFLFRLARRDEQEPPNHFCARDRTRAQYGRWSVRDVYLSPSRSGVEERDSSIRFLCGKHVVLAKVMMAHAPLICGSISSGLV